MFSINCTINQEEFFSSYDMYHKEYNNEISHEEFFEKKSCCGGSCKNFSQISEKQESSPSEGCCSKNHPISLDNIVKIHFILPNGEKISVEGTVGSTVLEVAHHYDIDIEGACGGSLSCSTCHVIVEEPWFERLPEATEDEEDMLDLAFDVTPTSRLCCQLILTPELNGLTMKVPEQTRHLVTMGRK